MYSSTKWKLIFSFISKSSSKISASLSLGKIKFYIFSLLAANVFSFTPPIFITFPLKEISPVIAKLFFIGLFIAKEIKDEVIATPAEGPSLGIAPSGAWIWISFYSRYSFYN